MSYPDIADLDKVNDDVNDLPYEIDIKTFYFDEWWARIGERGIGDCEDYALEKLYRLVELEWPIECLRLATVMVERTNQENHALLVVVSLGGKEYVLDQRQHGLCSLDDLEVIGYRPVRIQKEGGSKSWVEWKWA